MPFVTQPHEMIIKFIQRIQDENVLRILQYSRPLEIETVRKRDDPTLRSHQISPETVWQFDSNPP
jgi:hypothetical protein